MHSHRCYLIWKLYAQKTKSLLSTIHPRSIYRFVQMVHISLNTNFQENTEDWYTLMDLAAITHIPKELLSNQSIVNKLPVFFRTLRGQKPSRDELEELIKLIKEG